MGHSKALTQSILQSDPEFEICAVDDCGGQLVNYRDGRFCQAHLPFEEKCGIKGCVMDALAQMPACEEHRGIYQQWEARFGRDRSLFSNRRQMYRQRAIDAGEERMEWEPAPAAWDPLVQHYWQARHIKVVEIAVTACGIPLSHTKFPFSESVQSIVRFMNDTWPPTSPENRPTYLAIDKGCKVMQTLAHEQLLFPPDGWMATTNIKVDTWHYNSHAIDELCVTWCNPNDRHDPNLVEVLPPENRAPGRARARSSRARGHARREAMNDNTFQRSFNFEASEQLNAWLEPFSATCTKMKPDNHDLFLCIVLQIRAEQLQDDCIALA